jgi:hypothetical protein
MDPSSIGTVMGLGLRADTPDGWAGHQVVRYRDFILDPTADQASKPGMDVSPMVFPVPEGWDDGVWYDSEEQAYEISYQKFYRQNGWRSKLTARQWHWRLVLERVREITPVRFHGDSTRAATAEYNRPLAA